jgi:hypothetical protein
MFASCSYTSVTSYLLVSLATAAGTYAFVNENYSLVESRS